MELPDSSPLIHIENPKTSSPVRRSPRLVLRDEPSIEFQESNKRKPKINSELPVKKLRAFRSDSFFFGDPVPHEEAKTRWPCRYQQHKHTPRKGLSKPDNDDDDEDELILNIKCHYYRAQVEKCVFNVGDCAFVKGREGDKNYVGRILEFFKTIDDEDWFRVQWFFRPDDTVIQYEAASLDKRRLFYSTLENDNPLDCIVSKVKIVQIAPNVNLKSKSIPRCDFYYDMKYSVDYSTFSTMSTDKCGET